MSMEMEGMMPIKGLTDRPASFPQIGTIRKGAPKPEQGNKPGKDLEYFRFDTGDERAAQMFAAAYGQEPKEINIYFPYATPEENFQTWQEEYTASSLKHRCDGVTCVLWLDEKTGRYQQTPKPCPGGCKPTGRLSVIIPELQRFAYVTVGTTSVHDIMRITENLEAYYALRGDLRGIPFVLKRTPEMISTPGGQQGRVRREKWLLSVEALPEWVRLQLQNIRHQALEQKPVALLTVDTSTGEIIDDYDDSDEPDPAPTALPSPPTNSNGHSDGNSNHPDKISKAQMIRLHSLGKEFYGEAWDTERCRLVQWVSKGAISSSKELTANEADKLISGLQKKLAERKPEPEDEDADLWKGAGPHDVDVNMKEVAELEF
jgi:hypothetical protein